MTRTRSLIVAGLLAAGGAVATAVIPGHTVRAASPTPTSIDSALDSFRVEWSADNERDGKAQITGYVYNESGRPADSVVLRIDELDSSGQVVRTVLTPLNDSIDALGRGFFTVPLNASSSSYSVGVDSFQFGEAAS